MQLIDALKGIRKVIETEGDLEIERIIITSKEFTIVKENNVYTVDDYEKLIKDV